MNESHLVLVSWCMTSWLLLTTNSSLNYVPAILVLLLFNVQFIEFANNCRFMLLFFYYYSCSYSYSSDYYYYYCYYNFAMSTIAFPTLFSFFFSIYLCYIYFLPLQLILLVLNKWTKLFIRNKNKKYYYCDKSPLMESINKSFLITKTIWFSWKFNLLYYLFILSYLSHINKSIFINQNNKKKNKTIFGPKNLNS